MRDLVFKNFDNDKKIEVSLIPERFSDGLFFIHEDIILSYHCSIEFELDVDIKFLLNDHILITQRISSDGANIVYEINKNLFRSMELSDLGVDSYEK